MRRLCILVSDLDNDSVVTRLLVMAVQVAMGTAAAQHVLLLDDLTQLLVSLKLRGRALTAKRHFLRALR